MKWLSFAAAFVLLGTLGCSGEKKETQEGDKKLTVTAPGNTSIKQGESDKVTVKINREKFEDPVKVEFIDLPKGVSIEETDLSFEKGVTEKKFTMKVDAGATPAEGKAKVVASSGTMKTKPAEFTVAIKENKK